MGVLGAESDRRASRRRPLSEIPDLTSVKLQAEEVHVVNASPEGILFDCALRLPPGAATQLEILRPNGPLRVRGRVVRCEITAVLAGGLKYRVAVAFNDRLDFIDDQEPFNESDMSTVVTGDAPLPELCGVTVDFESAFALNAW